MRKSILVLVLVVFLLSLLAFAAPVFADPPGPACNGLDRAHDALHDAGVPDDNAAMQATHDLRLANHCDH